MTVELCKIVIHKIEDVGEVTLAKHVKATAKSLFGPRITGSKNMQLFYTKFETGGETQYHMHECESGLFLIKGKLRLVTDDGEYNVEANAAVFIPPLIGHKFKNIGKDDALAISVFSPPEAMYETES